MKRTNPHPAVAGKEKSKGGETHRIPKVGKSPRKKGGENLTQNLNHKKNAGRKRTEIPKERKGGGAILAIPGETWPVHWEAGKKGNEKH